MPQVGDRYYNEMGAEISEEEFLRSRPSEPGKAPSLGTLPDEDKAVAESAFGSRFPQKATELTLASQIQKARETPARQIESPRDRDTSEFDEPEEEVSPSLQDNIEAVISSSKGSSQSLDERITAGTNYKDAMKELDKELAVEEARLSEGLKKSRDSARATDLIKAGIQALAAYTAASRGIQTKLSGPLDTGEGQRLRELQEEVDNNRRVLRSRISSKKNLIDKLYSHEVREADKEERQSDREERQSDKEAANKERIDFYNEQVQGDNLNAQGNYDAALRKTEQVFLERWKAAPDKVRKQRLREWNPKLTDKQIDHIVNEVNDPDGILFWEQLPDYSDVKESIAKEALRIVRQPRLKQPKPGGSAPLSQEAPPPAAVEGTSGEASDQEIARLNSELRQWKALPLADKERFEPDADRAKERLIQLGAPFRG